MHFVFNYINLFSKQGIVFSLQGILAENSMTFRRKKRFCIRLSKISLEE